MQLAAGNGGLKPHECAFVLRQTRPKQGEVIDARRGMLPARCTRTRTPAAGRTSIRSVPLHFRDFSWASNRFDAAVATFGSAPSTSSCNAIIAAVGTFLRDGCPNHVSEPSNAKVGRKQDPLSTPKRQNMNHATRPPIRDGAGLLPLPGLPLTCQVVRALWNQRTTSIDDRRGFGRGGSRAKH